MKKLPVDIVNEDSSLEKATEKSQKALAELRWHWTLDESNPDRVSLREYGRGVGRAVSTISKYAKGYDAWVFAPSEQQDSISDTIVKASMSVEKAVVVEALADATGTSIDHASKRRDLSAAVAQTHDLADRKQITFDDAATEIGERARKLKVHAAKKKKTKKDRRTMQWIRIEGKLAQSSRLLKESLREAEGVDFTDEEMELIRHSIEQIRSLLTLIDLRMAGTPDIDWDAELANMEVAK